MAFPQKYRIRAGELRHTIQIQEPTRTTDRIGGTSVSWATVKTTYASINGLSAREIDLSQQTTERVSHTIRLRYWSGLTSDHRILWQGRVFEIDGVIDVIEMRKIQEVRAVEIGAVS